MDRDTALLRKADPTALAQIEDLERLLADPDADPPPLESILVWLNPVSVAERAEHAFGGLARGLEVVRNFLILVPLIVTWFSLALATSNFSRMVSEGRVTEDHTFLGLWEDGFNGIGTATWLSFSHVAYVDVGLLSIIAVLSFLHHVAAQRAARRVRAVRQLVERRLRELIVEVDRRRTEHHLLHMRTIYSSAFGAMGETLTAILADTEAQRSRLKELATQRELELSKLAEVSTHLKDGTERLVALIASTGDLATSVVSAASAIDASAGAMVASSRELTGLRADLRESLTGFTTHAKTWSDDLVVSWDARQAKHLEELHAELTSGLRDLSTLLKAEVVAPLSDAPVLSESADRIAQLNGAVARLDCIMQDVHQDATTLGAALRGLATYFGGIHGDGLITIEREDSFLEDMTRRR